MVIRPDEEQPVVELGEDECWALLADERFGRLGYGLPDEIHIVPVNHAVVDRSLFIATGAGNKLLAAELHSQVALEIDRLDVHDAWSVLVRGRLRHLEEDEVERLDLPTPWVPTFKYDVVQIVPEVVTGRRFFIERH